MSDPIKLETSYRYKTNSIGSEWTSYLGALRKEIVDCAISVLTKPGDHMEIHDEFGVRSIRATRNRCSVVFSHGLFGSIQCIHPKGHNSLHESTFILSNTAPSYMISWGGESG